MSPNAQMFSIVRTGGHSTRLSDTCSIFILCGGIAGTAAAQPTSIPKALEHEVVVVGSTANERERYRAFKASVTATVTSSDEIRSQTPNSLADGLRTAAPSISIQQTTPGQGTLYVRGLSGRAVLYAVDDVRVNMAFFRAGNNDYLGLIDPYSAASVVVVPGASSVEYGSDALGGAVLVRTEMPAYRADSPHTQYRIFQGASTNPLGTSSRVAVLHGSETFAGQVGFTYYQAGAIAPGGGHRSPNPLDYWLLGRNTGEPYTLSLKREQEGTDFEFYSVDTGFRHRLGAGWELMLKGQYSERPELVRYDQVTPRFKNEYPTHAERSVQPMSRAMVSAVLRQRRRKSIFDSAELRIAWQRIFERRVDRRLTEVCVEPESESLAESAACPGRLRLVPERRRTYEMNMSNALTVRTEARKTNASQSLSVIVGADVHHDVIGSRKNALDLVDHTLTSEPSRYPDGSTASEVAAFAHTRWRPARLLSLFAGTRASAFAVDMKSRAGDEPTPPFSRVMVDVAASLGVHWEIVPGFAWVLNAARGIRAPNAEDFAALGTRAGGRHQISNPNVRPEHSYTIDSGFKLAYKRHRAQATGFLTHYADAIVLAPASLNGQRLSPQGDEYYRSANASSVQLVGVEGTFDLAIAGNISTFGRMLVMQGTQHNPPEIGVPTVSPADRVPPPQAELGLRHRLSPKLQVEIFTIARAPQRRLNDPINTADNRIPVGGTPGYATHHARLKYEPDPMALMQLSLDNLSDQLALDHGSGFYRSGFAATVSIMVDLDSE